MRINLIKISLILIISSFYLNQSSGYVHNKSIYGESTKWKLFSGDIRFYFNPYTNDPINSSSVITIASTSTSSWKSYGNIGPRVFQTSSSAQIGRNDIYFSSDNDLIGGSGIVGVTQISYKESTGEILEADIILNDNFNFSSDPEDDYYLGNVITHELGHALGLSHSQVHDSSMFYKINKGQHSLHTDDQSGIYSLYPKSGRGTIRGRVVGGKDSPVNLFGVVVSAISRNTGKTIASSISNKDGSFFIEGLDLDDDYYLYTSPLQALESLPYFYTDTRADFCESGTNFRGSFFEPCYSSSKGFPQAVSLNSSSTSVDVGNITIKCNLELATSYIQNKPSLTNDLELLNTSNGEINIGEATVGFFSQSDALANVPDVYSIDLSGFDFSLYSQFSGKDLYLEIKTVYQSLYSKVYLAMDVTLPSMAVLNFPDQNLDFQGVPLDDDGNPELDFIARVPLDINVPANNIFQIDVTPEDITNYAGGVTFLEEDFFPSSSDFGDNLIFYFLIINVSEKNSDGTYTNITSKSYSLSDNLSCLDGPRAESSQGNIFRSGASSSSLKKKKQSEQQPISCATIDLNGSGPGSGPFAFLLGLLLSLALLLFPKKLGFLLR